VPGKVLAALAPADCRFLICELSLLGFKATRIDVRLDDFTKALTPTLVREAFERYDVTGFNSQTQGEWIASSSRGAPLNETFYIGKRGKSGSGKFVRCYTKWLESNGQVDSNRFEVEFSQHYAKQLFHLLSTLELSCWVDAMVSFVTGAVDFVDRQSTDGIRKDVANCPRLDWWEFVVGDVPRIRLSKPRKEKTIRKAIKWIEKQVLPTMAMVLSYFARKHGSNMEQIFWEAWQRGDNRMSDVHRSILATSLGEM
jgi:DNA relaxase NicK